MLTESGMALDGHKSNDKVVGAKAQRQQVQKQASYRLENLVDEGGIASGVFSSLLFPIHDSSTTTVQVVMTSKFPRN